MTAPSDRCCSFARDPLCGEPVSRQMGESFLGRRMPSRREHTMSGKLYTLDQATHELNRLRCLQDGHTWLEFTAVGSSAPTRMLCTRCGATADPDDLCASHGHHLEPVIELGSIDPSQLICVRCGQAWNVTAATA